MIDVEKLSAEAKSEKLAGGRIDQVARAISPGSFWDDPDYDESWGWKEQARIKAITAAAADPLTAVAEQMRVALCEVRDHLYQTNDIARCREKAREATEAYDRLTGEKP